MLFLSFPFPLVQSSDRCIDVLLSVLAADMFADEGLCVDSCGTGRMADENNTCVECDGECPLKGTLSVLYAIIQVRLNNSAIYTTFVY